MGWRNLSSDNVCQSAMLLLWGILATFAGFFVAHKITTTKTK